MKKNNEELVIRVFDENGPNVQDVILDAFEKYLEIKPDVLLLDLDLPKISGIEVINFLSRFSEERDKCNRKC